MIAFVLSGGGNLGALEAGALQTLFDAGIYPDLLVGTSVGAINASMIAVNPSPAGVRRLQAIWRRTTRDHIYPGGAAHAAWRLVTQRTSLYASDALRASLEALIPPGRRTFNQMAVPFYAVATDLHTGMPYVFGEDPTDSLLDGLIASAAIPAIYPPVPYRGRLLVDGALAANLPVSVALAKGARRIYALDINGGLKPSGPQLNAWEILVYSTLALMRQQWDRDLALCAARPDVTLHHIVLQPEQPLAFDDFTRTRELIARGRALAEACLAESDDCAPCLADLDAYRFNWRDAHRSDKVA